MCWGVVCFSRKTVCVQLAGSGPAALRTTWRSLLKIQMFWPRLELLQPDAGRSSGRLTPGQECPRAALLQRPPPQTTWAQSLPGDRENHPCENHQAHSRLLTATYTLGMPGAPLSGRAWGRGGPRGAGLEGPLRVPGNPPIPKFRSRRMWENTWWVA